MDLHQQQKRDMTCEIPWFRYVSFVLLTSLVEQKIASRLSGRNTVRSSCSESSPWKGVAPAFFSQLRLGQAHVIGWFPKSHQTAYQCVIYAYIHICIHHIYHISYHNLYMCMLSYIFYIYVRYHIPITTGKATKSWTISNINHIMTINVYSCGKPNKTQEQDHL